MESAKSFVERVAHFFDLESWFRLLLLCVLVGVVAGIGAVGFEAGLGWMQDAFLRGWLFNTSQPPANSYWLLVIPTLGGMLSGALVVWLAPEASGHGTDAVIRAFHRDNGFIRARIPLIKG